MQISSAAPQAPQTNVAQTAAGAAAQVTERPLPLTPREYEAVVEQRTQLSRQLTSASGRREDLAEELAATPSSETTIRAGLEQRISVLDDRIVRLEQEMAATGRQLTNAPASALMPPDGPPWERMSTDQLTGVSIVFTIFVLFPLAIAFTRLLWKRATAPRLRKDPREAERMERLEQALDTVAIEVERIGEGQRFMTRLLTESAEPAALNGKQRVGEEVLPARERKA